MTKRKEDGLGSRHTAQDLQDVHLYIARLLKRANEDLIDGDNDTTEAQRILGELHLINFDMFDVQVSIADKALDEAEWAAQRLAAATQSTHHTGANHELRS